MLVVDHTFICGGVTIEEGVFVGHHVVFINDRLPQATNPNGSMAEAIRRHRAVATATLVLDAAKRM